MTRVCKRFENASFENYICETPEQKQLVEALKKGIAGSFNNMIIVGGVGTGKTHLAYAILNELAEKRTGTLNPDYCWYSEQKVIYRSCKGLIDAIRSGWKDPVISELDEVCKVPLLIIDEVGVQYDTQSERTELYAVFNRRYEDMLPTIVISNNSVEELQKLLGQRIYDRLSCGVEIFKLTGKSKRG